MTHDERYCTNCQDYHLRLSGNGVTKACRNSGLSGRPCVSAMNGHRRLAPRGSILRYTPEGRNLHMLSASSEVKR